MKMLRSLSAFILAIALALFPSVSSQAQHITFTTPTGLPGQMLFGPPFVAQYGNDGMIGINFDVTEAGSKIRDVREGGTAASAGILPGDIVVSLDVSSAKSLDISTIISQKKDGETISLGIERNGESKTARVTVVARKRLLANDPEWRRRSAYPPGVDQYFFDRNGYVAANLYTQGGYPNSVLLELDIHSRRDAPFIADDMKFFVLDGTGRQVQHVSLDVIKYDINRDFDQLLAEGREQTPPSTSEPRQYTITVTLSANSNVT